MGHALPGHPQIVRLGQHRPADRRQKNPLGRLRYVGVLLRGNPHDRSRIDGIAAAGNRRNVENRIKVFERVKARMVAERTLDRLLFGRIDVSLDHEVAVGRNPQIAGQASHQLDRTAAQKPGQQILVQIVRHRSRRGVSVGGIAAQTDRHGHPTAEPTVSPVMSLAGFVHMPVHSGRPLRKDLHPVHAHVADAAFRIDRVDQRESDEASAVERPALQNRKLREPDLVARADHLLARPASPAIPGQPARHPLQQRQHAELVGQRRFRSGQLREEVLDPPGQVVETFHAQRQRDPAVRAHHVRQDGERRARPLEQQRPTASRTFRLAVGQLGDLQHRIDLGDDSHQLAGALQRGDIFPKIPIHDSICSFLTHCHTGPEYPSAHIPISRSCPPESRSAGMRIPANRSRQPHARQATTGRPASERNARASFPDRLRSVRHRRSGKTDTQRRSYDPSDALRLSASGRKSRYSYPCASYSRENDSKRLRKSG